MENQKKIFTLTQLNRSLEKHFWENFSNKNFWITAEIVKINEKNGHYYIELADTVKEQITARSSATIWATTFKNIVSQVGRNEMMSILQSGNKVLFNMAIEYHKIYGLKLNVKDIDPSYSYGEIERKRQEVIQQLKDEGIFDWQKKLRLPSIIKRIALVASPETSGYRDFMNELLNHHDFQNFAIKNFPVHVQGDSASKAIVKAIQTANLYDVDVIVILRGGGSKMDLALFDDYEIAKAICFSKLPVITGIGHETDEVIADLVARQYFITPTAVALHIQYAIASFKKIMQEFYSKISIEAQRKLAESKEEFLHCNNYLSHYSREIIHSWRMLFKELEFNVLQKSRTLLYSGKEELQQFRHHLSSNFNQLLHLQHLNIKQQLPIIQNYSFQILEVEKSYILFREWQKLEIVCKQLIEKENFLLDNQNELLTLLNPMRILANGYTISTINDKDVKDVSIQIGEEMKTLTKHSLIYSQITKIQNIINENNG